MGSLQTQYNTTELPCHTTALRPTQLGTFTHMNHTTTFELTVYLKSLRSPLHRRTIGRLHTFARLSSRLHKSLVNKVLCYFIVCMSYQAPVIIILGHPPGPQQSVVATMLADSVCLNSFFFSFSSTNSWSLAFKRVRQCFPTLKSFPTKDGY